MGKRPKRTIVGKEWFLLLLHDRPVAAPEPHPGFGGGGRPIDRRDGPVADPWPSRDPPSEEAPVTVAWSCEAFAPKGCAAPDIVRRCTTNMAPGAIVLLHAGARSAHREALPGLIEGPRSQGFAFDTVEEILRP